MTPTISPRQASGVAGLLALAAGLSGCDGGARVGLGHSAIVGGQLDDGDPAVIAIGAAPFACDDVSEPFCTGSLVAPRVVLTAAHCLEQQLPETLMVFFGPRVDGATGLFVDAVRIHPDYDPDTLADDVAVLHLSGPAPAAAVLPLQRVPLDDTILDAPARLVGFGTVASGEKPSGDKREGSAVVGSYTETQVVLAPDPAITCLADSGGPVFVDTGSGETIVGVVSFGDAACASQTTAMRADVVADFVDTFVADTDGSSPPALPGIDDGSVCEQSCASDDDCPEALPLCDPQPDGSHCVRPGQVIGDLGLPCAADAECGDGTCVVAAQNGQRTCRCLTPCGSPGQCNPDDPLPPGQPPCDPGCGCRGAGSGGGALLLVLLLLLGGGARRRRSWR